MVWVWNIKLWRATASVKRLAGHTSGATSGPGLDLPGERSGTVAQLMEHIEYQTFHDWLTDLPNRRLFRDRAEQALRVAVQDGSGFAVILLDLERFNEVNDTVGQLAGDKVLVEVGALLRQALPQVDTVARVGGDELASSRPVSRIPRQPA